MLRRSRVKALHDDLDRRCEERRREIVRLEARESVLLELDVVRHHEIREDEIANLSVCVLDPGAAQDLEPASTKKPANAPKP